MNLPLGIPGHFRVLPQLDPRGVGELHRGHTRTTPCAGCKAPAPAAPAPTPPVPIAPSRAAPPATSTSCPIPGCVRPSQYASDTLDPALRLLCASHRALAYRARREMGLDHAAAVACVASRAGDGARRQHDRERGAPPAALPALAARGWGALADAVLMALAMTPDTTVDVEALVLRAWKYDPGQFGLRGHEYLHPDPRRVLAALEGPEGLVLRGLCARPHLSRVRLTAAGRRAADALAKGGALESAAGDPATLAAALRRAR